MQNGIFQGNRSTGQATPGEERAWGMHDVSYSFEAQSEDDAYLLPAPVLHKRQSSLIEVFKGLARRLARH